MNKDGISKVNLRYLNQYKKEIQLNVEDSTRKLQLGMLYNFARNFKIDFDKATREDIIDYFTERKPLFENKKKLSQRYIGQEILYVSKLFKIIGREEIVKGLGKKKKKASTMATKVLLNEEEINKIIQATKFKRDKVMLKVLADTGCRVGELLKIKIGDVDFTLNPPIVKITGKTGDRNVPLMFSGDSLRDYIDSEHPYKNDDTKPLWIIIYKNGRYAPLSYARFYDILREAVIRAGIKKRVYPHLFRHSRVTEIAKRKLPDELANKYFGWQRGSKMYSHYTSFTQEDLVDGLHQAYNKKIRIQEKPSKLEDIKCSRCGEMNPVENKLCRKCNFPMKIEVSMTETLLIEMLRSKWYQEIQKSLKGKDVPAKLMNPIELLPAYIQRNETEEQRQKRIKKEMDKIANDKS